MTFSQEDRLSPAESLKIALKELPNLAQ